jgi:hypothetical protein
MKRCLTAATAAVAVATLIATLTAQTKKPAATAMAARPAAPSASKGFTVVDMEAPLRAAYGAQPVPFEFLGDMHWNSRGHAAAAAAVLKALADWPPLAGAARHE